MEGGHEFPVTSIIVSYIVACFNFLAAALCLFAFQALIRSSSIRKNSYNLYVFFLIFPDCLQNVMVGLGNTFFENRVFVFPPGFYETHVFVWFFYFLSNFYLNVVVAYEINRLVTASHRRQKTRPPKLELAWKQVVMVYLFAMVISLWVILPYKWSPVDIVDGPRGLLRYGSPNGGVIGPMATQLIGLVLLAIPITYVLYIRIRIACYKLLPKRGRTRVLSLFFMRIIIVFLLFYLPNTLLIGFLIAVDDPNVAFLIAKVITPLLNACQAYVTLYMVLWKDDIRRAFAESWNGCFGKCCCHMATKVPRRPSAGPSSGFASRPWGDSNGNSSSMMPPSLSNSNRTEPALPPKKSEWDEEDIYAEEHPADPSGSPESGPDHEMPEDHPPAYQDEEKPSNCRDCTSDWVQGKASGEDTS